MISLCTIVHLNCKIKNLEGKEQMEDNIYSVLDIFWFPYVNSDLILTAPQPCS